MSNEQEKTNEQILKEIIQAFSSLKQKMEDPNYAALDSQMRNMLENQKDMKVEPTQTPPRLPCSSCFLSNRRLRIQAQQTQR